jgi:hypothetical protein
MEAARADRCEAAYLRYLTELVEIMKLTAAERGPRLEASQRPVMVLPLEPLMKQSEEKKFCRWLLNGQAHLQCARVGLALERYRQAHGRWPKTLQDLVPTYLGEFATDPFDGSPLHYVIMEDGVTVSAPGSPVSFRLWDVKKRSGGRQ